MKETKPIKVELPEEKIVKHKSSFAIDSEINRRLNIYCAYEMKDRNTVIEQAIAEFLAVQPMFKPSK